MKSVWTIIREQVKSFYLVIRLSLYELKTEHRNNYLGILWEIINPMIQIGVYWFVFGFGIHKGRDVDGVPFIHWLLAGIVVWFFLNHSILQGSRSIYSRIRIISRMNFPMSVIPTYVIMSKFYQHIMLIVIIYFILLLTGETPSVYIIQLPYFMFASLVFLVTLSLITSTLATIVRDVQMVVQSIVRMLLYLTPILWVTKDQTIQLIMKINPLSYLVEGYRSALLGTSWYGIEHIKYTAYFWVVVLILLIFGSGVHVKFRDRFVDYL